MRNVHDGLSRVKLVTCICAQEEMRRRSSSARSSARSPASSASSPLRNSKVDENCVASQGAPGDAHAGLEDAQPVIAHLHAVAIDRQILRLDRRRQRDARVGVCCTGRVRIEHHAIPRVFVGQVDGRLVRRGLRTEHHRHAARTAAPSGRRDRARRPGIRRDRGGREQEPEFLAQAEQVVGRQPGPATNNGPVCSVPRLFMRARAGERRELGLQDSS